MYKGQIRGLGDFYKNGDERIEIHIQKNDAIDFPCKNDKRLSAKISFGDKVYFAGIRTTEKNKYIWVCPDLKDENDKKINLSTIIKENGLSKNQVVILDVVSKENLSINVRPYD